MAAEQEATAADHARVGTEHLLLAVVAAGSGRGAAWLRGQGIDAARLRSAVRQAVDRRAGDPEGIAVDDLAALGLDDLPQAPWRGQQPTAPPGRRSGPAYAEEARLVLDRARTHARLGSAPGRRRRRRVAEDDLVTALASVRGIRARDLLRDVGIQPERLRAAVGTVRARR